MRVAARFTVMVEAALTLLAGFGAARILRLRWLQGPAEPSRRTNVNRGIVCGVLCAAILVDLRMALPLQGYRRGVPNIYSYVNPRAVLVELPGSHTLDYMYFSTQHWAKLLTGYSGFAPDLTALEDAERAFPDPKAVETFRRLGATHLTYNCAFARIDGKSEEDCDRVFEALRKNPSLALIATESWKGSRIRLYGYYQPRRVFFY